MTALTKARTVKRIPGLLFAYGVLADAVIYQGAAVVITSAGWAKPGETGTSLTAVGIAREGVDNTGGSSGDLVVEVDEGIADMTNSAGDDEITVADLGKVCYLVDDQTVAGADGSAAGTGQVSELTITPAAAGTVSVTFNGFAPTAAFASSNVVATDNVALRNAINTHPQLIDAMVSPAVVSAGKVVVTFKPTSVATSFTDASAGGPSVAHAVTTANVAPTAATRSAAGWVRKLDGGRVYVEFSNKIASAA
jgi:hypothetical protein